MTATIRALASTDRTDWELLFNAYADFYKVKTPEHCADHVWQWIFDADESFWCDVAVDAEGQLIGFVQYQLMHRSLGGSKVCYLSDLFVNPDKRQSGTGKALIDHVMAFAKHNSIVNVRWLTQDSNATAKRLYDTYTSQSEFVLYSVPVNP